MSKSISFLFLAVVCVLAVSDIGYCSDDSDFQHQESDLNSKIANIRSILSQAKSDQWTHPQDWTVYGEAFLHLFAHKQDVTFVSEMTDWLIRDIPLQLWDAPDKAIRQFLKNSRDKPDREEIRLKLLDLLVFKAPIPAFSTPQFTDILFDPMPSVRRFMIQTLKEDGTKEAIPDLEQRIAELKSKPSPTESDLEEITLAQEAIENIQLWTERLWSNWIPDEAEKKKQAKIIIQRLPRGWLDGVRPPGFMDGCKYIIDRWTKFKYAARYIVENDAYDQGIKYFVIQVMISEVHDEDWNEAMSIIMNHYLSSDCMIRKGLLVSEILRRNSLADLKRLSGLLYSENLNDQRACGNLQRKYAEIGTEDCLPELRHAADFWREKNKPGTVQAIEKSIQAIEQRLGITPTVQPVNSGS